MAGAGGPQEPIFWDKNGDLWINRKGGKVGWNGKTPAALVALTQTYSTADATLAANTATDASAISAVTATAPAAATAAALTVADGAGTNDGTIGAISDNATTIAAVQELADQINKLVADVADIRTKLGAGVTDITNLRASANDIRTKFNASLVDLLDHKGFTNALVDALQACGVAVS